MPKGKILFLFCICFIGGIFFSPFINQSLALFFLLAAISCLFLFKIKRSVFLTGILLLAFIFGFWRYYQEANKLFVSRLRALSFQDKSVSLVGIVAEEPELKTSSQQLRISVRDLEGFEIKENLLVVASKYPVYTYGDKLSLEGKLKAPETFEGFNYQGYLQKEGIYATMVFPKTQLLKSNQGNIIKQALFSFKLKFHQAWQRFLSPPQLGIFEALVFGEENSLSQQWKEKLNFAGVRHLTAVSGMNITIIGLLLTNLFLGIGCWRQQASFISLLSIWLYILMIGAPASGVRAGLMVSLLLFAQVLGKTIDGLRSLVFAAAAMLLENPLLLRLDAGFQLSFLAMAGIIIWQPFFKKKLLARLPGFLKLNLATTLSSQVFTLPILIYNFGYFSTIALVNNLLLVPIVPYLTMIGFVFGSLGLVSVFLARIFSWFFWLGASYILMIVDLSLKIPFSHLVFPALSANFLIFSYCFLAFLSWRLGLLKKTSFI